MPNLDYITLDNPGAFDPGNDVTFRVRYSPNHGAQYCTLVVKGYKISPRSTGVEYTGGKFTVWASVALNGEGIQEIVVPGGTLAPAADAYEEYESEGRAYAYVIFGTNGLNEPLVDDNVIEGIATPKSNSIYLNMSMYSNNAFSFEYTQQDGSYLATGSILKIWMHLVYRGSVGQVNADGLKSYRIFLYNDNEDIIFDSGMKKDWLFPTYSNHAYKIKGLKNNKTYYVGAQAIINSGVVLTIPKTRINVRYTPLNPPSPRIALEQMITGVKLSVSLTGLEYTKIIINRVTADEGLSLVLREVDYPDYIYSFTDHYTIPNKTYIYNVVVYNGDSIVETISGNINYVSNYVVISDIFGSYAAIGNVNPYPISRNDRGQEVEVMDGQYPYYLINGDSNFERGSVDGIFGEVDECKFQLENAEYCKQLREWLNNGQPKLLCHYTGESWIVGVSGVQTTDPNNTGTLNTSFNWVQIGEGEDVDTYAEMGLIASGR